jgi:hypothetical protein
MAKFSPFTNFLIPGDDLYGDPGYGGFDPIIGEGEQAQFDYPGSWSGGGGGGGGGILPPDPDPVKRGELSYIDYPPERRQPVGWHPELSNPQLTQPVSEDWSSGMVAHPDYDPNPPSLRDKLLPWELDNPFEDWLGGAIMNPPYESIPGWTPWGPIRPEKLPFEPGIDTNFEPSKQDIIGMNMPEDELPPGYEWQFINGEWLPIQVAGEGIAGEGEVPGYGGGQDPYTPEFTQELIDQMHPSIISGEWQGPVDWAPVSDYQGTPGWWDLIGLPKAGPPGPMQEGEAVLPAHTRGEGGIAGNLAKRLYYPSTTGGFASTGSGIGGASNTLADLLKQLKG